MFPLSGTEFPKSAGELAHAIEAALRDVFTLKAGSGVTVEGGAYPSLDSVTINLDGASLSATKPPGRSSSPTTGRLASAGQRSP